MASWLGLHAPGLVVVLVAAGCWTSQEEHQDAASPTESVRDSSNASEAVGTPDPRRGGPHDEIDLWDPGSGPHLRGANIFLTRVHPDLDRWYKGPAPVGPPYVQADFDLLSGLGANVVTISMPGLFTEAPPWEPDPDVEGTLDDLLDMIRRARMFVVIAARTGPGRNEFGFHSTSWSRGVDFSDHSIWELAAAQQAWVDMWRYTAERYRDDPIVVGYYPLVEPNAADVIAGMEAEPFYERYRGTLLDWNQLYPRIIEAIREEDPVTPVIIDSDGWAGRTWLPFHPSAPDSRIVYSFHQYLPLPFTIGPLVDHAFGGRLVAYGADADLDGDGRAERFDADWIDDLFAPVDAFIADRDARMAVTEFGLVRWVPTGARFMSDQMEALEARGINSTVWLWNASFEQWHDHTDPLGLQFGPADLVDHDRVAADLVDVVSDSWARNAVRP